MDEVDGSSRSYSTDCSSGNSSQPNSNEVFAQLQQQSVNPVEGRSTVVTGDRQNASCTVAHGTPEKSRSCVKSASYPVMPQSCDQRNTARMGQSDAGLCYTVTDCHERFQNSNCAGVQKENDSRQNLGLSLELRPDPVPQEQEQEQRNWATGIQAQLSLHSERPDTQPSDFTNESKTVAPHDPHFQSLRSDTPPPDDFRDETSVNPMNNLACQRSMTGSFIQQCSDAHEIEASSQFPRESNLLDQIRESNRIRDSFSNRDQIRENYSEQHQHQVKENYSRPNQYAVGYNEHSQQNRFLQRLIQERDFEIQELKDANHRQSQFIEKLMSEKKLLERAIAEQARLIISQSSPAANRGPSVLQPSQGGSTSGATFDQQLYETQLAMYKEDFENERKEKQLAQSSVDSLQGQLRTVLNELGGVRQKLSTVEEELNWYRTTHRYQPTTYQHYTHELTAQSTSAGQSSSSASAAPSQGKKPLYRKSGDLELDQDETEFYKQDTCNTKTTFGRIRRNSYSQPDLLRVTCRTQQECPDLVSHVEHTKHIMACR